MDEWDEWDAMSAGWFDLIRPCLLMTALPWRSAIKAGHALRSHKSQEMSL